MPDGVGSAPIPSGQRLFIWKKDCAEVHSAMQNMHHLDRFSIDAIENQIIAVNDPTDIAVLVARNQGKPPWCEGQCLAPTPVSASAVMTTIMSL
jgi:hypothetical protein